MKHLKIIFISLALSGCSIFTEPMKKPVIEDKVGINGHEKVGTLSLTPERRTVVVNLENSRLCAEAPTEVGLNLSDLLNATAKGDIAGKGNLALGLLLGSSSGNSVLNKRSQAVQMFLGNSYFLCQMFMNGAIGGKDLLDAQNEALKIISPVLEKEITLLYNEQMQQNNPNHIPLDINKMLEKIVLPESE